MANQPDFLHERDPNITRVEWGIIALLTVVAVVAAGGAMHALSTRA